MFVGCQVLGIGRLLSVNCFHDDLLLRQMLLTQRQTNLKDRTLLTLTVTSLDSTMVHIDNHLTEVQPNARTVNMQAIRVGALIEAVKDMLQAVTIKSHTGINDLELEILVIVREIDIYRTAIETVLKGI